MLIRVIDRKKIDFAVVLVFFHFEVIGQKLPGRNQNACIKVAT